MNYRKIYITGVGGVGKTYFAKKISLVARMKNYELDDIVFEEDSFKKVDEKKRDAELNKILKLDEWVIDGASSKEWIAPLIRSCDVVIVIKRGFRSARKRIYRRFLRGKIFGNKRKERFSDVVKLARASNDESHKDIMDTIQKHSRKHKKQIMVLSSKEELNNFLKIFQ